MTRESWWWQSMRCLATAMVLLIAGPAVAYGDVTIEMQPLRDWPSPMTPTTMEVDSSVDGVTLMVEREQASTSGGCRVTIADEEGALRYDYRHDGLDTRCVDAVTHPEGGYFLRGDVGASDEEVGQGFTVRVGRDGQLIWAVDDSEWSTGEDRDGVTGAFLGDYDGPRSGMAYDATNDRLIGLSQGNRILADEQRPVMQAHGLDGASGDAQFVGQAFGALANEPVVELVARDGEFLVVTTDSMEEELRFYSFEVGRSMTRFDPSSQDWRVGDLIFPVEYRADLGTFFLWDDGETSGLMRVEGLDSTVWSEQYVIDDLVEGDIPFDVAPEQSWVGESLIALRYGSPEQGQFLVLVDVETGLAQFITNWDAVVDEEPVDIVRDGQGELVVLAFDTEQGRFHEYGLQLVPRDAAANSENNADETPSEDVEREDEQSGCQSVPAGPGPALVLGWILLGWWWRTAEQPDCLIFGGSLR